jgi:hypothetical protein
MQLLPRPFPLSQENRVSPVKLPAAVWFNLPRFAQTSAPVCEIAIVVPGRRPIYGAEERFFKVTKRINTE